MIKISVITPVHNASAFIRKCLSSVLSQTLHDIEVVCINDGSTDSSKALIDNIILSDNRVKLLSQENAGSGKARNFGLTKAEGEFVAFLDADDWYPDDGVLEKLYKAAKVHDVSVSGGSFVRHYSDGRVESEFKNTYKAYRFEEAGLLRYSDYQFDYGYHRFIYDRERLMKAKVFFPDYRRYQDPVFFTKAMILAEKFYAIPDQVYAYRKGHQSIAWDEVKVSDLICGISDNLFISRAHGLGRLHRLNATRVFNDFKKPIAQEARRSDAVRYYLRRMASNVDIDLIESDDPKWPLEDYQRYMRDLINA